MCAKCVTTNVADILNQELREFSKNPQIEPLFVFPTEIQKNSWMDWAVSSKECGIGAVNKDQFIAWDQFKSQYVQPVSSSKKMCIPPLLRKYFAQQILENLSFRKIINKEQAEKSIYAFTDWLAKILPSLALWYRHYQNDYKIKNNRQDDDETLDLADLYGEYSKLLAKFDFYEPAFSDINFDSGNRKIFLFYPVILQDFAEYYDALAESENVTFVVLPDNDSERIENPDLFCLSYNDSRKELRHLCLKIRQLCLENENFDLTRVAVNVPDLENIRPYIEREFNLYQIPYVLRDGLPYTKNCGGDIFVKIKDCLDTQFSPDSVRNLLLDGFIPWKNGEMNLKLVQAGVSLRIICAVSDKTDGDFDIWETSLAAAEDYAAELEYYKKLKEAVCLFGKAHSFRDLKNAWKVFVKEFVDEEKFALPEFDLTNKILGRIITELTEYMLIEEDFSRKFGEKISLNNYMDFWLNELQQETYNPDVKKYGVNIFSYRVASCADFDWQFIINANQKDITVPLKTLSFITDDKKREFFGLNPDSSNDNRQVKLSEDGSLAFIQLYNGQYRNTHKNVFWSSSKVNFNGAAITHTGLKEIDEKDSELQQKLNELEAIDFVKKISVQDFENQSYAPWQKEAFELWKNRRSGEEEKGILTKPLKEKVRQYTRFKDKDGKIWTKVSASGLNSFFPCPKKWLFQNVMGLEEEKYSPEIAKANELGTLYHRILELILTDWKNLNEGKGKVPVFPEEIDEEKLTLQTAEKTALAIKEFAQDKDDSKNSDLFKSLLASKVIHSQEKIIIKNTVDFLKNFCKKAEDPSDLAGKMGGLYIIALEQEIILFENDVMFKGQIDCILGIGSDNDKEVKKAIVVDYKSGHVPTESECIINDSLKLKNTQMAIYVKLLESQDTEFSRQNGNFRVAGGVFYSIKNTAKGFENHWIITENKRDSFDSTLTILKDYVEEFKKRTDAEGSFNLESSSDINSITYVNKFSDCEKCRFKTICRRTFTIGQKD